MGSAHPEYLVEPDWLAARLDDPGIRVVDVTASVDDQLVNHGRTACYEPSHVPGSVNIPQDDLGGRAGELPDDRDAPLVMVCNIGKFSKQATLYLKSLGYRNVKSMKGGLNEWVRKGLATESNSS